MGLEQISPGLAGQSLPMNADRASLSAPPHSMQSSQELLAFLAPTRSSSLPMQGQHRLDDLSGPAPLSSSLSPTGSTLFWMTSAVTAAIAFGRRRLDNKRQRPQQRGQRLATARPATKTSTIDPALGLDTKRPGHSTFIAKLRLNEVVPSPSELMALFQPSAARAPRLDSPDGVSPEQSRSTTSFTTSSPAPTSPTSAGTSSKASSPAAAQAAATATLDLSSQSGSRFGTSTSAAPALLGEDDDDDLDEDSNTDMWSSSPGDEEGEEEEEEEEEGRGEDESEPESLRLAYEKCRDVTSEYSKTFFLASKMLPSNQRRAVWAVYNWCRITDELVDGPTSEQTATLSDLAAWELKLQEAFRMSRAWPLPESEDWQQLSFADSIRRFNLSPRPYEDMIAGVSMDLAKHRYRTFEELKLYCYRVAGTVGLMMLPILNGQVATEELIGSAMALGTAFQLTNILRDVGEDGRRGRIYLPLEDMRWFGVSEEDMLKASRGELKGFHKTRQWEDFMEFQIQRCESFYKTALDGIPLLSPNCRFCVLVAWKVYRGILESIRRNGYDNFQRRAYVSKPKKAALVAAARREVKEMASQQ